MAAPRILVAMAAAALIDPAAGAAQASMEPALTSASVTVEATLPGSPEAIYDAISGDISMWWDHTFSAEPARLFIEARPGGRFLEIFNDSGDGVVHATVIHAERGRRLRFDGPLGFSGEAIQIVTTYDFSAAGADSTRLAVRVNAAGALDEGKINALRAVWQHFILRRFKPYVEERHAAGLLEPGATH